MSSLADSKIQIAGIGHVYYGAPDTEEPDLYDYKFGDGTTLEAAGWTWLGDTSSENLIEIESEGGEFTAKRTWDRQSARSSRSAVTHTLTINSVSLGKDTMEIAFPGSVYDADKDAYDLNLAGSTEKAFLIVIEDGNEVGGFLYRRVTVAGALPAYNLEEFTEIKISGTILSPNSGKSPVRSITPRQVTGKGAGAPTVTNLSPKQGRVGSAVVITGTNFDGVRSVKFGDHNAVFTKNTATQITATVPGKATGAVDVTVTNNIGSGKSGDKFTVQA